MVIRRSGPGGEIPSCGGFRGKEHFCFLFMLPTLPRCLTETGSTQLTWFFSWKLHIVLLRLFPLLSFCCCFLLPHFVILLADRGTWVEKILEEFQEILF